MTADNPQTTTAETDESQTVAPPAEADELGDAGKRALQALRQEVKDLKAELNQYKKATEPAPDAERDASEEADSASGSATLADDDGGRTAMVAEPVKQPTPPQFHGTADAGARRDPAAAAQLTAQDLRSMAPRAIERARREGRLRNLLGGNGR